MICLVTSTCFSLPPLSVHGKKMAVFFALIALLFAFSEAEIGPKPLSDEMVDYINSVQTTWKAGRNFESVGFDIDYVKRLCGVPLDEDGKPVKPKILQGIGCVQLSASQQLMCQLCTYQFVTSTPLRAYHGHLTPSPSPGVGHLTNRPRGWGIWPNKVLRPWPNGWPKIGCRNSGTLLNLITKFHFAILIWKKAKWYL